MAISKIKSDSIDSIAATKLTGTVDNARITLDAAEIPNLDAAKITTGSIANARVPASAVTQHAANEITQSTAEPTITTNPAGGVGTVWLRKTTGEMYCCTDATTNNNVWTNIGDGAGAVRPFVAASGGTITTDGNYKVHTFTSSGTFTITSAGDVEYLVVAGGGGAPRHSSAISGDAAGGGAGGMLTATGFATTAQAYTITVGAGGAGQSLARGLNGSNSVFSTLTCIGGGGGCYNNASGNEAQDGGSGGGGMSYRITPGSGTAGQGNNGGTGLAPTAYIGGAGGGGKGAVGQTMPSDGRAGNGGAGANSSITGSAVGYAGGGGGMSDQRISVAGGTASHGGGAGGPTNTPASGTVNTGGGAGGSAAWASGNSTSGQSGGSGVVIIRYKYQ